MLGTVGVIVALAAVGLVAAGSGEDEVASREFPAEGDWVSPGRYATSDFLPKTIMSVDAGWIAGIEQAGDWELRWGQQQKSVLSVVRVSQVIDPAGTYLDKNATMASGARLPVPEDLVGWLRNHKRLVVVEQPRPVDVAGESVVGLDVKVSGAYAYEKCKPCVPLFVFEADESRGGSDPFWLKPSNTNHLYVLNVNRTSIVIAIEAPPGSFDAFRVEAEKVIATIKFSSG